MQKPNKNTPSARLRKSQIAAIQIAKKQLGWEDEMYRDLCEDLTGKRSSAKMNSDERGKLLDIMRKAGAKKPSGRVQFDETDTNQVAMIKALWLSLYREGHVKSAMLKDLRAYVERMTLCKNEQWLDALAAGRLIEAMKQWCYRLGIDIDSDVIRDKTG